MQSIFVKTFFLVQRTDQVSTYNLSHYIKLCLLPVTHSYVNSLHEHIIYVHILVLNTKKYFTVR